MSDEMKSCPFCGEVILKIAIKCTHCGVNLDTGVTSPFKPVTDYGMLLLAPPVATTFLIWFWISGLNLLQSPGSTMSLLILVTVLGTAIITAMEASKAGMKFDIKKGTYSPTAWFFIISLIWIIGYPVYLYQRKNYGLSNRLVMGGIIALIFVGSCAIMDSAIDSQKEIFRGDLEQVQQQLNSLAHLLTIS
jgi:rRNA maturation protein Nop10